MEKIPVQHTFAGLMKYKTYIVIGQKKQIKVEIHFLGEATPLQNPTNLVMKICHNG